MHIMTYCTFHNNKISKHTHRMQYAYVRVDQMRQLSKSSTKSLFTTQGHVHRMYIELKLLSTVHILKFIERAKNVQNLFLTAFVNLV
jgi:hypothetical protein